MRSYSHFRSGLSLASLVLTITFTSNCTYSPSCSGRDVDCPSGRICVENTCLGSESSSCSGSDSECVPGLICQSNECVTSGEKDSPLIVFQKFASALQEGHLNLSLNYIHPEKRPLYQQVFSGNANLPLEYRGFTLGQSIDRIAAQLQRAHLVPAGEFGPHRDYTYDCQDAERNTFQCLIRFTRDKNGYWKIKNL